MVEISELKAFNLLRSLSDQQLQEVVKITVRKFYQAGASVYSRSQPVKEIFLVEKGLVSLRASKSEDNHMISFDQCKSGDLFGVFSLFKGHVYELDAVCMEDTVVLVIDADKLSQLCEADVYIGYAIMKKTAELYLDRYEVAQKELGDLGVVL